MNSLVDYKMSSVDTLFNYLDECVNNNKEDEIDKSAVIAILKGLSLTVTEFCNAIYNCNPAGETFHDYENIVIANNDDPDDIWDYIIDDIIEALNNAGHAKLYPVLFKDKDAEYVRLCECPFTERPDIKSGYIICYDDTEHLIWAECDSKEKTDRKIYQLMEEYDLEDDSIMIFDKQTSLS